MPVLSATNQAAVVQAAKAEAANPGSAGKKLMETSPITANDPLAHTGKVANRYVTGAGPSEESRQYLAQANIAANVAQSMRQISAETGKSLESMQQNASEFAKAAFKK